MGGAYRSKPEPEREKESQEEDANQEQKAYEQRQAYHEEEKAPSSFSDLKEYTEDIKNASDLRKLASQSTILLYAYYGHVPDELLIGPQRNVPVHLADVQEGARSFRSEENLAEQRDNQILCVVGLEGVEAIPVDSRRVLASATIGAGNLASHIVTTERPWSDLGLVAEAVGRSGLETEVFDSSEAQGSFLRNMRDFVFQRLLGSLTSSDSGRPPGGSAPPQQGLAFTVHADREGLRIHYTPIYLHSGDGMVLGAPSTPVSGLMEPGAYYFGGATVGPPKWDTHGVYEIPPAVEAHLRIEDPTTW